MSSIIFIPASTAPGASAGGFTFEYVNKNLGSYDYVINYTGNNITTIVYDTGNGQSVTKTFAYTNNKLTTITLSGDTPLGIKLVKTLTYTGNNVTGVAYS